MNNNKITLLSEIMITAHYIKDKNDKLVLDKNNRIITKKQFIEINRINGMQSFNISRINLQQRLIELEVNSTPPITAFNLKSRIKNIIILNYINMGYAYKNINKAIDNYFMNNIREADLFIPLIESELEATLNIHNKTLLTNEKTSNLNDYLSTIIQDSNTRYKIINCISELAINDTEENLLAIMNNLFIEFDIQKQDIQLSVIKILFGENKAIEAINAKSQISVNQKKHNESLKKLYEISREQVAQMKAKKTQEEKQQDERKYLDYLKMYRKNGIDLPSKDTLAIGSTLIDHTGANFNKNSTIFCDFEHADLKGDIHNTIDELHGNIEAHNKFKFIVFTNICGFIFENMDESISLIFKLYDLLKNNAIIVISCGVINNKNINSNAKFAKNILSVANFKLENITNSYCLIYNYDDCLSLVNDANKPALSNEINHISLIIKKA